jgi:hypothetical protein
VRILGPAPGARVRSGRAVSVVVRVSTLRSDADGERFPEAVSAGDDLPPGWVLVVSQDTEPAQTVGRKVGHIGDFRGLPDGVHSLNAWLADNDGNRKTAEAAVHFFVGSPRPSVRINFPTPGAFVTDNPISVLFSAEEFEIPGDGFIAVSINGEQRCAARDHAIFHCDLRQVPTGNHTVFVTLLREGTPNADVLPDTHTHLHANASNDVVVATQFVNFTVRRLYTRMCTHTLTCICAHIHSRALANTHERTDPLSSLPTPPLAHRSRQSQKYCKGCHLYL